MFRGDGEVGGATWEVESKGSNRVAVLLNADTRVGALALRKVALTLKGDEGKHGGTEIWRDFEVLRGEEIQVRLRVAEPWERCDLGEVPLDSRVRAHVAVFPSLVAEGNENMETFCCGGSAGFSSITRDFEN